MKHLPFTLVLLMFFALAGMGQNVGFNDNNSDPDVSAMLDVCSTTKGMLIPRVSLDSTLLATPITSPATSLLVYNTATTHDVLPGYYYWNGTKWVRLETSEDFEIQFSVVEKTESCTLIKTETVIAANGDITITLPAITDADNGMEVVVKNVGTYTDLIVVKPQSGYKIDNCDSSVLTRWRGRTYIAYGSNWIVKNKDTRADHLIDVSTTGSFTTIQEAIEFLEEHMDAPTVIRLGGGSYEIIETQTIDLPYPVAIEGLIYGSSEIICPAGDTAFNAKTECYFKWIAWTADEIDPGIGINFSGWDEYYELKDSYFYGFDKGIYASDGIEVWIFESDFEDCITAGIEIDADTADINFKISECDFINDPKGIHLLSYGTGTIVTIQNCNFFNSAGQTGIYYVPGTISPYYSSMIIQNNSFNNIGSFSYGFDFSLGRDADIFIENNAGVPTKRPNCKVNITNSTAQTTISSSYTWYKLVDYTGGTSNHYITKWEHTSTVSNRITYLPDNIRDATMFISGNITCYWNTGGTKTINLAIVKNTASSPQGDPTRFGETTIRFGATGTSYNFSMVIYLENVQKNDYFEIWVESASKNLNIVMDDLGWFTDTH